MSATETNKILRSCMNTNNEFCTYMKEYTQSQLKELKDYIEQVPPVEHGPLYSTEHTVLYSESTMSILKYSNSPENAAPLLIVPSLINKYYILDLMEQTSFVKYAVDQGVNVYLIDWGTPGPEHDHLTFDHYIDTWMNRAVKKVCRDSGCDKVTLLGYCMGGTMAAIYTALHQDRVAGLVSLAAPYDFSDELPLTLLAKHIDADLIVDSMGSMPPEMLQTGFSLAQPTALYYKMMSLYENNDNEKRNNTFIHLERWLSDNIPFPKEVYRSYIKRLYQDNELVNGTFDVNGRKVKLNDITVPLLNVVAKKDNIVNFKSATALNEQVNSETNDTIEIDAGHIGVIMGRKAASAWDCMVGWFKIINGQGVKHEIER